MAGSITQCTYYRDWAKYNDDLVKRGELIGDLRWLEEWDSELEKMNKGKRGRPFEFPASLFRYCAMQMFSANITYRMMEGHLRCILGAFGRDAPDHSTIEERCGGMEWPLEPPAYLQTAEAAFDSTGIGTTVRGEWLRDMYHIKRGFVKLHALTDPETDAFLSYAVTSSGYPDGYLALPLVDSARSCGYEIDKAYGDAAYDQKDIWTGLIGRGIEPVVNLKENDVRANGCLYKGAMIRERRELGAEAWKAKHGYGRRWKAECSFSDFKRMLGGSVRAKSMARIVKELSCKVWIFNRYKKFRGQ